jgi:hypothetical protein
MIGGAKASTTRFSAKIILQHFAAQFAFSRLEHCTAIPINRG